MAIILVILIFVPIALTLYEFFYYVSSGTRGVKNYGKILMDILCIVAMPLLYIYTLDADGNDCCTDSATFSPEHRFSIYSLIVFCATAYFYSRYKSRIVSPLLEVLSNILLLLGILLNILIAVHVGTVSLLGNVPIIILFILQLADNHENFLNNYENLSELPGNKFEQLLWSFLKLKPWLQVPILFLLSIPVMSLIIMYLMLFGQKPDALIRAFTETYKHGLSQMDYVCANVECGGHFLCSVAANGHDTFVKPERLGERGGKPIVCNRQLLISNAFEELIEQKAPRLHRFIRKHYNKVGNVVHRYYGVFNNKWFADLIYVLMKPLEWLFLLVLYTFDAKPENRIAQQYLKRSDRQAIKDLMKK